jgi:cytochrome c biogenesis protein CcdA
MKRTHLSLYYLIGYLIPGGTALLTFPRLTLRLFFFNTDYGDVLPRFVGMLMLALGLIIIPTILCT